LAIVFFAVSNLVAFGIIVFVYRSTLFTGMLPRMEWREYKQLLGFSMPLQAGIIIQFFNYRLDAFLVNFFLGTLSVGLYVMAVNLVEILWLLSTSMASVLLPTVAAQHEHSKKILVKAAMASFGVTVVGGIVAFVIAPPLIVLLFGKDFAGSVAPFLILLPGIMIFNTAIAFVSLIFTVVLDLVLIPRIGIAGAAFASSVSYTVTSLMSLVIFIKLSGLTWAECGEYMVSFKSDFQSIATRARLKMLSIVS
jgi:O-antigen/teichoic acid export membrane protein